MGFSDLGKKLSKLGQDTKNGVQKVSDSVTISNRISQEKKSLERLFATIGESVYKDNPNNPKPGMEDEWAAVKVAYANIATYTEQLNHVKGIIYCPNCGRPAANGDKFCAKCGFRLDVHVETTGEKMARDIKEAGQEVGHMAGQAADKTGEMVGGAAAGTQNAFSWLKSKLKWNKKEKPEDEKPEETQAAAEPEETQTAAEQGQEVQAAAEQMEAQTAAEQGQEVQAAAEQAENQTMAEQEAAELVAEQTFAGAEFFAEEAGAGAGSFGESLSDMKEEIAQAEEEIPEAQAEEETPEAQAEEEIPEVQAEEETPEEQAEEEIPEVQAEEETPKTNPEITT